METRTYMGLDWGNVYDGSYVSIIDENGYEVFRERFSGKDFASQRRRVIELHSQYGVKAILAERNSIGSVNIEALQAEGFPVHDIAFTKTVKENVLSMFQKGIMTDQLRLINPTLTANEMIAVGLAYWGFKSFSGGHIEFV